jgi:hypothetical protein
MITSYPYKQLLKAEGIKWLYAEGARKLCYNLLGDEPHQYWAKTDVSEAISVSHLGNV